MDIRGFVPMLVTLVLNPVVFALNMQSLNKSSLASQPVPVPSPSLKRQVPGDFPLLCGIIGGVGPAASADVDRRLVEGQQLMYNTLKEDMHKTFEEMRADLLPIIYADWTIHDLSLFLNWPENISKPSIPDQKTIPFIIGNNPQIPDRISHIKQDAGATNPLPQIRQTAKSLVSMGANCLAITSILGHEYLPELREELPKGVHVLNMMDATLRYAAARFPDKDPLILGVLADDVTLNTGLFQKAADHASSFYGGRRFQIITPSNISDGKQENVMKAIYGPEGIKAGFDNYPCNHQIECGKQNFILLYNEAKKLTKKYAHAIVAGSSEIALVFNEDTAGRNDITVLHPSHVLADTIFHLTYTSHLYHDLPDNVIWHDY